MGRKLFESWSLGVTGAALSAALATGCSGGDSDDLSSSRDAAAPAADAGERDAGPAEACPSTGEPGSLRVEIVLADGVEGDVRIVDGEGATVGAPITATGSRTLPAGRYTLEAHRVREPGELVGPAYQPVITLGTSVCVLSDEEADARVAYTREPGSARLWLSQSNGSGAPIMAFDADQLAERGDRTPSTQIESNLPGVGPLRVDALGQLWVGANTGVIVGFATGRLGDSQTAAPDVTLSGPALCEEAVPCGPRALAFDAEGALFVATLSRIVKLAPESLARTGEPSAELTITSPAIETPRALAFDAEGNLWVGDSSGAILRFDAARLDADLVDAPPDVVIYAGNDGPVRGTFGDPEGLVFDADGNLWVGYFGGNTLVRVSPEELALSTSVSSPLISATRIVIGTEALITDLAMDEAGNLWFPGGQGALYTIARAELSLADPAIERLTSAEIGSVERLTFNTVPGPTFIAP